MLRLFNVVGALIALGGALSLAAAPASAQVIDGASPDEVAAMMEDYGMPVEIESVADAEGPVLSSSINDFKFLITFEACDEDGEDCELMVFRCGFSFDPEDQPDLETLNGWNSDMLGKAAMDETGNPWIILAINTVGGITEDNLMDTLSWWEGMMIDFADYIGYQP